MLTERFEAQLLAGAPARDPVTVTERLLAVQAQDPRGVRLAIRARTIGVSAADVDRALTAERSLVITTLNRGTLHLVRRQDYPWLHALTRPSLFTANQRRLRQEGVSAAQAERGVAVIARSLADEGPLTRSDLAQRLNRADVSTAGQALVHILLLASLRGVAVRGPMLDGQHAYALVEDWLGPSPAIDPDRALAELARRYLAGHAPADARDLARWAGLPLRQARAGLAAIAAELAERPDGLLELHRRGRGDGARVELPPPRLLGAFDPVLLGWTSREAIVGRHHGIVTVNGLFRPFALIRGRAAGLWRLERGRVVLAPFSRWPAGTRAALADEARDVERFLSSS